MEIMKRCAACILIMATIGPAASAARTTVGERADRFAEREAQLEHATGYSVEKCRRRRCWVTLYGIWSPLVNDYADLSGLVILPRRHRAYWRDFD